jgi:ribosomal protein S18 acetylase RimI-like enzyme
LHDAKIVRLRGRREVEQTLKFLSENRSINLYLFEGVAGSGKSWVSFSLEAAGGVRAVLHTKNGSYFHLFLLTGEGGGVTERLAAFFQRRYPRASVFFGEKEGLDGFFRKAGVGVLKRREYLYMETGRRAFAAFSMRSGGAAGAAASNDAEPPVRAEHRLGTGAAMLLLDLQIGYEMEELGVDRSEISRSGTVRTLEYRLARGEITALFREGRPVAMASVNARYGPLCQIGSVYVAPSCRGRGYGRSVISAHVGRLLLRYERVALIVDRKNARAVHLYDTMGFRKEGELLQAHVRPWR